jgi:hypothetical protein
MTEVEDKIAKFQALLTECQREPRPKDEKRSVIDASLGVIYAARDRQVPWHDISETLVKVGIKIHRETLRLYIESIERDYDQYPDQSQQSIRVRKKKRRSINGQKRTTNQGSNQGPSRQLSPTTLIGDTVDLTKPTPSLQQLNPIPPDQQEHAAYRRVGRKP